MRTATGSASDHQIGEAARQDQELHQSPPAGPLQPHQGEQRTEKQEGHSPTRDASLGEAL